MVSLLNGVEQIVRTALSEDSADNDVTSAALIGETMRGSGVILVKEQGVVAGLPVAGEVFRQVDLAVRWEPVAAEGARVRPGDIAAKVEGPMRSLLAGERVALNFLQRLSGIASITARYVDAVSGTRAEILDTRKTTPGLRSLEKYAVRMGGGRNHRMDLSDGVLIKDNHIAALRAQGMTLAETLRRALAGAPPGIPVEIEVASVEEAREAISAGARTLLLDNMGLKEMRTAAALASAAGCRTEASGGINLDTVRTVAETGVDQISSGSLTHSMKALDISLEIEGG